MYIFEQFRWMGVTAALTLAIFSYNPAYSQNLSDIAGAPTVLDEVDSFRWYIVTNETDKCPLDLKPSIQTIFNMSQMEKNIDIIFHEEGGAMDVFLFRIYFDTVYIKNAKPMTCLLISKAELGYFDRISKNSYDIRKLILWNVGDLYDQISHFEKSQMRKELSQTAATNAFSLLYNLLDRLSNK